MRPMRGWVGVQQSGEPLAGEGVGKKHATGLGGLGAADARIPRPRPPIFLSAPPMPSGLRGNLMALRLPGIRAAETPPPMISRPKNAPTRPSTNTPSPSHTTPPLASLTSVPPSGWT